MLPQKHSQICVVDVVVVVVVVWIFPDAMTEPERSAKELDGNLSHQILQDNLYPSHNGTWV